MFGSPFGGPFGYNPQGLDGMAQNMGYANWEEVPKDGGFAGGKFSLSDLDPTRAIKEVGRFGERVGKEVGRMDSDDWLGVATAGVLGPSNVWGIYGGLDGLTNGGLTQGLLGGALSGGLSGSSSPKTPGASEAVSQALGSNPYQTQGSFGFSPFNVMQSYYGGPQSQQQLAQQHQQMQSIGNNANNIRNGNAMTGLGGIFGDAMNMARTGVELNQSLAQNKGPSVQTAQNPSGQSFRPEMGGMQQYQQQLGAPYMPGQQSQGTTPYGAGWGQMPRRGGFAPPSVGMGGGMPSTPTMGNNWVQQLLSGLNQAPSATTQPQGGGGGISYGPGNNQYAAPGGVSVPGGLSYEPFSPGLEEAIASGSI